MQAHRRATVPTTLAVPALEGWIVRNGTTRFIIMGMCSAATRPESGGRSPVVAGIRQSLLSSSMTGHYGGTAATTAQVRGSSVARCQRTSNPAHTTAHPAIAIPVMVGRTGAGHQSRVWSEERRGAAALSAVLFSHLRDNVAATPMVPCGINRSPSGIPSRSIPRPRHLAPPSWPISCTQRERAQLARSQRPLDPARRTRTEAQRSPEPALVAEDSCHQCQSFSTSLRSSVPPALGSTNRAPLEPTHEPATEPTSEDRRTRTQA
jgi:hypothetical protein